MRADLHVHSAASDGSLAPGAIAVAARAGGLDIVAVCDHDTIGGVIEAQTAAPAGLRVIPGLEISSLWAARELHVLGYFVDPAHLSLVAYSTQAAARREQRMREMVARLARSGINVAYEDVVRSAEVPPQCIGRPHLARALVQRGHARSVGDAFDRWIGDEHDAYVAVDLLGVRAAIDLIHEAGGVAVWAHPRIEMFDREIRRFRDWGIDGVECYRPRLTPTEAHYFETAAHELGLLRTGGSDWHGTWHGRLGDFAVGEAEIGALLARGDGADPGRG
ncbi:MAG TPA: PHP domain-containing protein [Longimicrobiales bacterium]|nr:PHP domain-containing protein [Longimicrobiales bacterium]